MSRKRGIIGAIVTFAQVFVLAAVISLSHTGAQAKAQGSIDITGTVTNSSGVGVANVSVYATAPGTDTVDFGPITTAADGTYDLQVSAGTFDFHFDPPSGSGLNSVVESNVTVLSDQTINVQFEPPTYTYSGTMTDQNGDPMPNMRVSLNGSGSSNPSTTTDSAGNFSLTAQTGIYTVQISFPNNETIGGYPAAGFITNLNTVDLTANTPQNFAISLNHLTVVVKDGNGNPESGVSVNAFNGNVVASSFGNVVSGSNTYTPQLVNVDFNTQTDSDGAATVLVPQGVTYSNVNSKDVSADFTDGTIGSYAGTFTVSNDTSININEPPTYTYSGTMTDQNGDPMPNMRVSLNGSGSSNPSTTTDSAGNFSLTAQTGIYTVQISFPNNETIGGYPAAGFITNLNTVDLTANTPQNFAISLNHLTVVVKDGNGNPESGVSVNAFNGNVVASSFGNVVSGSNTYTPQLVNVDFNTQTDSDGAATVLVPQGVTYSNVNSKDVSADFTDGTIGSYAGTFTVSNDTSININEPPTYTYSGTMTDQNGDPMPNMRVSLNGSGSSNPSTTTDSAGNFSLTAQTGIYTVQISFPNNETIGGYPAAGFITNLNTVDLTANTPQNFAISLNHLTVVVKDGNGNPESGVSVNAFNGNVVASSFGNVVSGSNTYTPQLVNVDFNTQTDSDGAATVLVPQGVTYSNVNSKDVSADFTDGTIGSYAGTFTVSNDTSIIFSEGGSTILSIGAPVNLSAPSLTNQYPSLSWSTVSGAAYYNIYRNGTDIGNTVSTEYTDISATQGTYSYYVTAVSSDSIQSAPSRAVTVVYDTTPPTVQSYGPLTKAVGATLTLTAPATDDLSGVVAGEYFVGTIDPGVGSGIPMAYVNGMLTALPSDNTLTNLPVGTYQLNVRAEDAAGNWSSIITSTLTVANPAPLVSTITAPATTGKGVSISTSATFTDSGPAPDTASWNWGDGSTSIGTVTESNGSGTVTGSHTYTKAGSYVIVSTVTGSDGETGTSQFVIAVSPSSTFKGANLSGLDFSDANFSGVNMTGDNMQNTTFNDANFTGADLAGNNANGGSFLNANFTGANLAGANFQNAKLANANLTNVDLAGSNLSGANLTDANLTGADLKGANFGGATMTGVTYSNTTCPNNTNSNNDGDTCIGKGGGL